MEEQSRGFFERVERLERDAEVLRGELRSLKRDLSLAPDEPVPGAAREKPRPVPKPKQPASRVPASWSTVSQQGGSKPVVGVTDEGGARGKRFALLLDLGDFRSGEWWLGRIGIALLLFGVSFLYLLSVERGWITPPIRVGFGLAIGVALVALGLRAYGERRSLAQVLLGGGIGAFYVTGYAAYAFYGLVPHAVAFAFMVAVTLLAFAFSVRQDGVALALVGALGGLVTPFVLHDGSGSVEGLVIYTCIVLAGTAAIYFYKGWGSLLAVSLAGGWSALAAGLLDIQPTLGVPDAGDRYALQFGVLSVWLLFWLTPVLRRALLSRAPDLLSGRSGHASVGLGMAHAASATTPLIALAFTQVIWSLQQQTLGFMALGGAILYALTALAVGRLEGARSGANVSRTQALVALMLLTLALVLVLNGEALLFALAAEAAVLHVVARRIRDTTISAVSHLLSAVAGFWVLARILPGPILEPHYETLVNAATLTDLAVIVLAFAVSRAVMPGSTPRAYRSLAHVLALGWLAGEILPLPEGDTWTLVAWTLYATGLHLFSRWHPVWGLNMGAHALSAVVALWLGARLLIGAVGPGLSGPPVLDLAGLGDLAVIAILAVAGVLPGAVSPRRFADAYRLAAHIAFLAWTWRELSTPPGGEAYVTISWGLYAVVLLVAGLRLRFDQGEHLTLFRGGMTTLFLVVGKLFLVDLASIDAAWRVLLFLGFGALFLALSYGLRALWRPGAAGNPGGTTPDGS